MTHIATAKILLFIALNVGPHNASTIFATSNSEAYTLTADAGRWDVEAPSFPASDFTRDEGIDVTLPSAPTAAEVPANLRDIAHHDWSLGPVICANGDRVERHGNHIFYIINAGGANEKVYTILFPTD